MTRLRRRPSRGNAANEELFHLAEGGRTKTTSWKLEPDRPKLESRDAPQLERDKYHGNKLLRRAESPRSTSSQPNSPKRNCDVWSSGRKMALPLSPGCPSPSTVLSAVSADGLHRARSTQPLSHPGELPAHPKSRTLPRRQHHPSVPRTVPSPPFPLGSAEDG